MVIRNNSPLPNVGRHRSHLAKKQPFPFSCSGPGYRVGWRETHTIPQYDNRVDNQSHTRMLPSPFICEVAMRHLTYILSLAILSLLVGCASDESRLRARADAGELEAQYQLASMYQEGRTVDRDPQQALMWYRRAAEGGHREAQDKLAESYDRGDVLAQDYVQAAHWYAKAAEQGDVNAQIHLAQLYLKGQGVPQNYARAKMLLEQAAAKKSAEAEYRLGRLYWEGRGVPTDRVQAHKWFNLSAAQGHKGAATLRLVVATEMGPEQVAEAQRLAVEESRTQ
jgi:TPR repeat protein